LPSTLSEWRNYTTEKTVKSNKREKPLKQKSHSFVTFGLSLTNYPLRHVMLSTSVLGFHFVFWVDTERHFIYL